MTDWNRQKVPELRAELKKRGLPQNGLKAELVARLTAADNESGFESEATIKGNPHEIAADSHSPIDGVIELSAISDRSQPEESIVQSQSPLSGVVPSPKSPNNTSAETINIPRSSQAKLKTLSDSTAEISKLTAVGVEPNSLLPAVDLQEAIEDKQKRKRRSQSPLPSATDVRRKRIRVDEEATGTDSSSGVLNEEVTTTKAGTSRVADHNVATIDVANDESEVVIDTQVDGENGSNGMVVVKEDVNAASMQAPAPVPDLSSDDMLSHKNKDSRFKDLFSAQTSRSMQESNTDAMDNDLVERSVAPSIHPATSALYIRDFMRPLNPSALKEHLNILATAPNTMQDPDVITNFYIDPIRTHAFISFKSVSAASRVRSELHDQIWPEERTRKPLWADFIPAQRVSDWIAEEQSSSAGSRSAGRKWEVVYSTNDEGAVTADLQEAGSFAPPIRKPSTATAPPAALARSGIEGAPSGPRAQSYGGAPPPSTGPSLDRLFRHTNAKPVLYYQPVSKELAEKRLDHMEDATSKHYSPHTAAPEINRYTFEDGDVLVDRGPEIFSGIRRPVTERVRGGGSGFGGGGGRGRGRGDVGYRFRGGDRYEGSGRNRDPRDRGPRDRRY